MVTNTMVSGKIIKKMVKEFLLCQVEKNMKEYGKIVK